MIDPADRIPTPIARMVDALPIVIGGMWILAFIADPVDTMRASSTPSRYPECRMPALDQWAGLAEARCSEQMEARLAQLSSTPTTLDFQPVELPPYLKCETIMKGDRGYLKDE